MTEPASVPRTTACEACNGLVSISAKTCPHCGHPRQSTKVEDASGSRSTLILGGAGFLILCALFFVASQVNPGGGGLSNQCGSNASRAAVDQALANAPVGKVLGISVVQYSDVQTVSRADNEVKCSARALLSNATEQVINYRFFVRDGDVFVEARLEGF